MSILKKKVKCQGQKVLYQQKGLITRNTHVKYQSFSTHCSKVISKVNVSERRTELQTSRAVSESVRIIKRWVDRTMLKSESRLSTFFMEVDHLYQRWSIIKVIILLMQLYCIRK